MAWKAHQANRLGHRRPVLTPRLVPACSGLEAACCIEALTGSDWGGRRGGQCLTRRNLNTNLNPCSPPLPRATPTPTLTLPLTLALRQYTLYSFHELLPHHVRYTQKVFRSFDHLYKTRADNGLLEYIQGYNKRANLPHEQTCQQIMQEPLPLASYTRRIPMPSFSPSSPISHACRA